MRSARRLFYVSALLIVASALLLIHGLRSTDATFSNVIIAGSALLAASAGWVFNNAITVLVKVREQSLNYLKHATEGLVLPEMEASLTADWRRYDLSRVTKVEAELNEFCRANYPNLPFFKTLRMIANQYEQMAVAIKCDAVEERMLRLYFASLFDLFFSRLTPFLPWFRNYPKIDGHPFGDKSTMDAFSHCIWLADRWEGKEGK